MRILSLGAGVQSSTLALMASCGELEKPDCAIFADTGWEPKEVYDWLAFLECHISFPVVRVQTGDLRKALIARALGQISRVASIPAYTWNGGISRRQCTQDYKITPITRKIFELNGAVHTPTEMWIGISLDEIRRMKPSRVKWITTRWPLIEKRMTRQDCLHWLRERDYPRLAGMDPPKSSCLGCPFHDNAYWRRLRDISPGEWADTVAVDKAIRDMPGFDYEQYLHRSLMPLDEVDLSTEEDMGQLDMFDGDCEGMCGV